MAITATLVSNSASWHASGSRAYSIAAVLEDNLYCPALPLEPAETPAAGQIKQNKVKSVSREEFRLFNNRWITIALKSMESCMKMSILENASQLKFIQYTRETLDC